MYCPDIFQQTSPAPVPSHPLDGIASSLLGGAATAVGHGQPVQRLSYTPGRAMRRADVTPDILRDLLTYDSETGAFVWRERPVVSRGAATWNARHASKPAMTSVDGDGYLTGSINGIKFMAHRVAWAMHFGAWPRGILDHVNRDKKDNRIENLRLADPTQSSMNRTSSGEVAFFGVTRCRNKFRAHVAVARKRVWTGTFATAEEAAIERDKAALIHHGTYACLNFPEKFSGAS